MGFAPENTILDKGGVETYTPDASINMYLVHWHMWGNGTCMADIIQLDNVTQVFDLVLKHGQHADPALNCHNSLEGTSFYLNNFSNKENFYAIPLLLRTLFLLWHMLTMLFPSLFHIWSTCISLKADMPFTYVYHIFTLCFTCVHLKANTPLYLFKPVVRHLYSLAFHWES